MVDILKIETLDGSMSNCLDVVPLRVALQLERQRDELLAALEGCLSTINAMRGNPGSVDYVFAYDRARALIAKIRREA